jgi:hypothetical protein
MAGLLSNEKYVQYFQKVNLLYKRPEIRASLEVILSVFTVTILVFAAIRPTITNIVSLQKKITDQEIVNKKADNKITQLINAQKQLDAFRGSLRLFDAAVPDVFSYVDGGKRLEYLARKNYLTIDSMGFAGVTLLGGKKITGEWAGKIALPNASNGLVDPITFSVSGKPQNVITFLQEVETMDRLVMINSVSLSKQIGLSKMEDTLKASGQMTIYFYAETP